MNIDAAAHIKDIRKKVGDGKKFIFLDFDGTISDIVNDPDSATPAEGSMEALKEAVKIKDCFVSVISGRNLADLKKYFAIGGLILCGNHGAEIKGQGIDYRHPLNYDKKKAMDNMVNKVRSELGETPGLFIENKDYAAAVHYRKTREDEALRIEKWFETLGKGELQDIRIRKGKKVFEILPGHSFGKADAVMMIVGLLGDKEKSNGIIFAGDDATDTEAFVSLGNSAVKIFIGANPPENADYSLMDPSAMAVFLKKFVEIMGDTHE
jgi:alpha,alpha-trehalase